MSKPKAHLASLRLLVNAGMRFPQCRSNAKALDLTAGRWEMTRDSMAVTCKHCLNSIRRGMQP